MTRRLTQGWGNRHNDRVRATDDLLKGLSKLGDVVFQGGLRSGRVAAARVIVKAAKNTQMVTRRTGNLFKGIKVSNTKTRTRVMSTAPHSYVVERGHGGPHPAGPHPFLESATRATGPQQMRAFKDALASELRKLHTP